MSDKRKTLTAWDDDTALQGPNAPKNDGHIEHLIRYLLTVYDRFGNTAITCDCKLQWGATALWKRDEQKKRITDLERDLAAAQEQLSECTKMLHGEHDAHMTCHRELDAAQERLRAAREMINECRRIPVLPFPDPDAHSWQAFGTAVHRAWSNIQRKLAAIDDAMKEKP